MIKRIISSRFNASMVIGSPTPCTSENCIWVAWSPASRVLVLSSLYTRGLSLQSIISDPGSSFDTMQANFTANYQAMAVQAIGIGITFKFAKKLLRKPISNVNRNLMKPLGIGVRL